MANAPAWSVVSPRRGIFRTGRTAPKHAPTPRGRVVLSKWGEERVRSRVGRGLAPCRGLGTLRPTSSSVKGEDGEEVGGRRIKALPPIRYRRLIRAGEVAGEARRRREACTGGGAERRRWGRDHWRERRR